MQYLDRSGFERHVKEHATEWKKRHHRSIKLTRNRHSADRDSLPIDRILQRLRSPENVVLRLPECDSSALLSPDPVKIDSVLASLENVNFCIQDCLATISEYST